jgi:hypothetical protein
MPIHKLIAQSMVYYEKRVSRAEVVQSSFGQDIRFHLTISRIASLWIYYSIMWIQVRTMDGKKSVRVDGLSKLTKIEELREKLVEPFEAARDNQRLFYRGKQVIEISFVRWYVTNLSVIN